MVDKRRQNHSCFMAPRSGLILHESKHCEVRLIFTRIICAITLAWTVQWCAGVVHVPGVQAWHARLHLRPLAAPAQPGCPCRACQQWRCSLDGRHQVGRLGKLLEHCIGSLSLWIPQILFGVLGGGGIVVWWGCLHGCHQVSHCIS